MEKILHDKSRLIDDVILNEIDYLHRNVEKLQTFKSKSLREINTLHDKQRGLDTVMEVKLRDFEIKESTRMAEYVKSSINHKGNGIGTGKGPEKQPRRRKESCRLHDFKKRIKNIKSSGYGNCQPSSGRSDKAPERERHVISDGGIIEAAEDNSQQYERQNDDIVEEENTPVAEGKSTTATGDGNVSRKENDRPQQKQHINTEVNLAPKKYSTAKRSKLNIVNDKVKPRKVPVVEPSPPKAAAAGAPYLTKNPRERIVEFW